MKYLASYLLLQIGGKANPSAKDITTLLATVGIEAESDRIDTLLAEINGKNIDELIAEGTSKLASVPSGGAAAASSGAAAGGAGAAASEKKEEKKEEPKEESDEDMGFGLFD